MITNFGVYMAVLCILALQNQLIVSAKDSKGGNPLETQHTECTLISGDIKATAEASVTRKLEGFCATDHLSRAFGNLEYRLLNEINHLRAMINLILPPPYQQHYMAHAQPQLYEPPPVPLDPSSTQSSISSTESPTWSANMTRSSNPVDRDADDSNDVVQNESPLAVLDVTDSAARNDNRSSINSNDTISTTTERVLHFRPVQKRPDNVLHKSKKLPVSGPRDFEIHKLNNTILSGDDLQMFTYYWKLEQLSAKLKQNISIVASPIFSIAGLELRIKAYLNHLNREFLFLQLEQVEASYNESNNSSNVILKTGDLYEKLQTKLMFKHTITILNQVTSTNDLVSQELANTSMGFLVPNSAILSGPFAKNDGVFIKVVIRM